MRRELIEGGGVPAALPAFPVAVFAAPLAEEVGLRAFAGHVGVSFVDLSNNSPPSVAITASPWGTDLQVPGGITPTRLRIAFGGMREGVGVPQIGKGWRSPIGCACAGGNDEEVVRKSDAPTFRKAAAAVIDLHRPTWRNPKSAAQWEACCATTPTRAWGYAC